jgi:hypothetical protein
VRNEEVIGMEDEERCNLEKDVSDMPGLADIRESPDILKKIKWEVTPQMIMEPRFQLDPEDLQKLNEIAGYMLYIETQCEPPALMLMKVGKTDITSTVGRINELPSHLLQGAIDNPVHKPVYGMYAITDEIKEWLKRELGV